MHISEISVKRPSALMMFVALFIGLGIFGYSKMGADLLPSIDVPIITVTTVYNGASAENIKKDIVKPIEDAVTGISGVDTIQSTAGQGVGTTVIAFKSSANMNTAFIDVQKAIDNATGNLPKDAEKPILNKMDTNQIPVLILSVNGNVDYDELYRQADKVKQALEKVPGAGQVQLFGTNKKQLFIEIDKSALEYYNVNINTLSGKLRAENIDMPAGEIEQPKTNQAVSTVGEFQNIDEIRNLTIPTGNGGTVRLSDIAEVRLDYPKLNQAVRQNGKNTMAIIVQKQSDANVVSAAENMKKELDTLRKTMPKEINVTVAVDTTQFITSSLSQVQRTLIEGILTTALVLFIFLRSWRSSLVVLVAIPTALISAFFVMYINHFTLNMMSLLGLTLCVGILVDDSIVVLENIQRHLSMGKNPIKAAIEGRQEIGLAAIAITLCDVVVFAPVALMSGMIGQYFKQFGLTIVAATLFSLLVSFTLTPMLSSRLLKHNEEGEKKPKKRRNGFIEKLSLKMSALLDNTTEAYKRLLIWSLDNRKKVVGIVTLCLIGSIALIPLKLISLEAMPVSDQSSFTINVALAPGVNLKQTDEKVVQIEKYLGTVKEVEQYFSMVGNNNDKAQATIMINLVPKDKRIKSQSDLAAEVRAWGKKNLTGVDFSVSESQNGPSGGSSKPIQINITGDNSEALKEIANKVEGIVKTVPGIIDVGNSTRTNESKINVRIDRLAAAEYGVSATDIATILRTSLAGISVGTYREANEQYTMTLKFMDNQITNAEDIGALMVTNAMGQQIPLSQLATIVKEDSPQSISRLDRKDVVKITANLYGRPLGDVNTDLRNKLKSFTVPTGYEINFGGNQEQMAEAFSSLIKALAASIALVYMVLVVLYESYLTPFIRLLSLPCAIIGALLILAITRQPLSMLSMIGLIMLDGLASKNGTLLIDYTNTLMKRGLSLEEALIESGTTRLRPIIMTSMTMIMGMLPAALSMGEGSEMMSGVALIIIGGMIASTILSPIVLPVVYIMMDNMKKSLSTKRKKNQYIAEV